MRFTFENLYIIFLIILGLFTVSIVSFLHKKHLSLKIAIPLSILLFASIAILIKPTINYPIISNPKVPKDEKIKYIAKNRLARLGYNVSDFNISIEKKEVNWVVKFIPKDKTSVRGKISIFVSDNFQIIKYFKDK